jgi:uncharacterized membrane protein YhaH (DUF805 family)
MNRYLLLTLLLFLTQTASADQLEGLQSLDVMLILGLIAAVSILVLFISLLRTVVNRLANEEFKVSVGINFSCLVLIICALLAMIILGSQIDQGFLVATLGTIAVSCLLIVLNYKVGSKHKETGENN